MKKTAKFFVIVSSALLLAIVAASNWRVNGNVKVLKANQQRTSVWADGSMPIPPPPTGLSATATTNALFADGSMPIPPPPTGAGLSETTPYAGSSLG